MLELFVRSRLRALAIWLTRPDAPVVTTAFLLPLISILGGRMIAQFFIPICLWYILLHRQNFRPWREFLRTPVLWLPGAIVLWGWISNAWSITPEASASTLERVGSLILGGAVMLALAQRHIAGKDGQYAIRCALFRGMGLALFCIFTVLAFNGGISAGLNWLLSTGKPFHPTMLKQGNLVLSLLIWPLFIAVLATGHRKLAYGVLAVSVILLFCMPSSTACVSILASVGFFALAMLIGRKWSAICLFTTMTCVVVGLVTVLPETNVWQFQAKASPWMSQSMAHRLHIWKFAVQTIEKKPLQGWGVKASGEVPHAHDFIHPRSPVTFLPLHPHNNALQMWLELGAVGLGLYAALWAYIAALIAKAGKYLPREETAACFAAAACAFTGGMAGFGVWQSWWVNANMLLALLMLALILPLLKRGQALDQPSEIDDA